MSPFAAIGFANTPLPPRRGVPRNPLSIHGEWFMATEKYGVDAQLVKSLAQTPVSTDTNVIFIGASPNGDLNKAYLITSMADYAAKLGGEPGDGYNLTEAAIAAFSIAGISQVYMIPVSNSKTFTASDYIGNASLFTGVYAIENLLRENPTTVNLLCAPSITDSSVIAALNTIAKKADGHWVSFMLYDLPETDSQLNESNAIVVDEIVDDKQLNDENADAVWGHAKSSGGYIVSGAALRACLMAASDANYGVPARCGGNLAISGIQGVCYRKTEDTECDSFTSDASESVAVVKNLEVEDETIDYDDTATYVLNDVSTTSGEIKTPALVNNSGKLALEYKTGEDAVTGAVVSFNKIIDRMVSITESAATQLSADGICSYINYGGGNWHTWGDHTSAFSAGSVSDERARYDSNIRMLIMLTNRFQLKYRFSVDEPMTLMMRNDVIQEENDYLAYLKSIGALIGNALCSFNAEDNPQDNIALGQFVWSIEATNTPPMKYAKLNVAYSSAGLSVYYE